MEKLTRLQIRKTIKDICVLSENTIAFDMALVSYYVWLREQTGDNELAENMLIAVLLVRAGLRIYSMAAFGTILEQFYNPEYEYNKSTSIDKNKLINAYRQLSTQEIHDVISLLSSQDQMLKYKIDMKKILNVSDAQLSYIIDNFDIEYGLSLAQKK